MHPKQYTPQIDLEVSVLSGDQLMYQSMKCEPPETPHERTGLNTSNSSNPTASAGILITSGGSYKVPEASNNWKAEVKRIWNKPVEQLPIGIDLPRLATSIFVPAQNAEPPQPHAAPQPTPAAAPPTTEPAPPPAQPSEPSEPSPPSPPPSHPPEPSQPPTLTEPAELTPATHATPATPANGNVASNINATEITAPAVLPPVDDEIDTKARDIMHTLYNMGKFVEGEDYAQKLVENFGSYVILEGAKDRDMSREISRLVGEYLGKESKVVKLLKACNQAIIAPAVIELTLNVCAKVPFKDAGGWRMEITKNDDGLLTVTHIKQQRQRSSNKEEEFSFEWHLEIIFDEGLTGLSDVFLSIPKLTFGPHVSQSTMEGIQYTFAPYLVRR